MTELCGGASEAATAIAFEEASDGVSKYALHGLTCSLAPSSGFATSTSTA